MIHGGLRYLLYDVPTTRVSNEDAGRIRKIAPHITWRIPFLWPLFPGRPFFHEATEALLSAYDVHARRKGGPAYQARQMFPEIQCRPPVWKNYCYILQLRMIFVYSLGYFLKEGLHSFFLLLVMQFF